MSKKKKDNLAGSTKVEVAEVTSASLGQSTPMPKAMQGESPMLKNLFFGSLILMLFIFLFSGFNVGFHKDEMDMNSYCKANVQYYLTGGKDTTYLGLNTKDEHYVDILLRYYGSAFEYIPVIFNKVTGIGKGPNEYNSRHIFIQLFAVLALLFAGLIARKAGGWRASLFTIWLLYLTPIFFGLSLFNSKDIPFCAGYLASLYFIIRFLEEMPSPTWRTTLTLMGAFAFTTGTRIGGVLLLFYLGLFLVVYTVMQTGMRQQVFANIKQIFIKLAVVAGGGITLVVITWPFVLSNPVENLGVVLTVVKKFPLRIPLNFEGYLTDSLSLPAHYLLKMMGITLPVFALLAVIVGVVCVFAMKLVDRKLGFLILFSSLFPLLYAIATQVAVYSSWRHFLFVYPGLCVFAGVTLDYLFVRLKNPAYQAALVAACLLAMAKPVSWVIKNHPYGYCYFNEFAGGYKGAFNGYETDYWKITMKDGLEWLMKHERIMDSKDTVTICSDMDIFIRYYVSRHYPGAKVKVEQNDLTTRNGNPWKYCVFSKQFLSPEYLEKYYPPKQTIYAQTIDGMPETVILKDTIRYDISAKNAYIAGNYRLADSFLTEHFKLSPDNIGMYGVYALIKAEQGKYEDAIKYAKIALEYNLSTFTNYNALCALGEAYATQGQIDFAIEKLNEAMALVGRGPANDILAKVMQIKNSQAQGGGK